MASSRPLDETRIPSMSLDVPEIHTLPSFHRLSILNGLLIGLAISGGFWAQKLYSLSKLPLATDTSYVEAVASSALIILLCVLTGWFTGRLNRIWLTIPIWLVTAMLITVVLGYIPAYGRNLTVWFADDRFSGIYVYALPQSNEWWVFAVAGFVLIFILFVLAVLQAVRLERAFNELKPGGKLSTRAFFILLMPALFAGIGAYIMPDNHNSSAREAMAMAYKGVETVQNFEGDSGALFELTRDTGFNYSALNGVKDQLDGAYTLMVGEVDENGSQVAVTAHFASGVWINCRVNTFAGRATYLSFCADASRPYTEGFASLITGEPLSENCFNCLPQASDEWHEWLQARADRFNGNLQFDRLGQQGNFVWMRAASSDNSYAVDCLFQGVGEVILQECVDVSE